MSCRTGATELIRDIRASKSGHDVLCGLFVCLKDFCLRTTLPSSYRFFTQNASLQLRDWP